MLASPRLNGLRFRAALLLVAGWLLPAAASATFVLHEIEHAGERGAPAAIAVLLHGHLHSESEAPHSHELAVSPETARTSSAAPGLSPLARASAAPVVPADPRPARAPRRDDPDPGGPSRQASLSVFRI